MLEPVGSQIRAIPAADQGDLRIMTRIGFATQIEDVAELARRVHRSVRVLRRPILMSGMLSVDDDGVVMLINSEQAGQEQAIAIWHETIHLLLFASGQNLHDEEMVESLAQRLARCVPDIAQILGFDP